MIKWVNWFPGKKTVDRKKDNPVIAKELRKIRLWGKKLRSSRFKAEKGGPSAKKKMSTATKHTKGQNGEKLTAKRPTEWKQREILPQS